ncbi:lipopolysaccharide biosynthesis protein [Collinsella ihumii]|uniref:lipopolysaccharide biosynthesis protein n=1 Tax=Collinsella ihumii TaxID=1720204 RepID=UPI0025AA6B09|nr:oligosaccharide flippase family protein [Collinsella ihumii]MDN0055077.1 oligosaccharide flippase family protein [Collinsella ihumii]
MSRARLFVENFLIYGLGTMAAKVVPLVMLPIVTRLMPDASFFGYSDLSNTLVSLMQPVAVMGMYDAMFRMYFDDDSDGFRLRVCSSALFFVVGVSAVITLCILLISDPVARLFFGGAEFINLAIVSAATIFVSASGQIIQAPTRMMNQRSVYIVINLGTAVLSYAISVPLLLFGEYLMALPVAAFIAAASSLLIFAAINRRRFSFGAFDFSILKTMVAIGIPLMPSFLFYWVFSSTGRLVIVSALGAGAAGVYAVAAKIGQISQLIYNAFAQGWQYFAFSTMGDDDQVKLNSRVFEYLGVVSLLGTALVIAAMDPVYSLLFSEEYAGGIVCVPYLFLAPLLLMLYQVAVNQLIVVKRTWPSLIMLALGAAACFFLQVELVPLIGIEGAAIGTVAGYLVTTAASIVVLTLMGLMAVRRRLWAVFAAFSVYFLLWRFFFFGNTVALFALFMSLAFSSVFLYRKEASEIGRRFFRKRVN